MRPRTVSQAMGFVTGALLVAVLLGGCTGTTSTPDTPSSPDVPPASDTPSDPGASSTPLGQELVLDRCTACHSLDRIKAAQHDRAGWEATVARMRQGGARLTDAEAEEIVQFLSAGGGSQL